MRCADIGPPWPKPEVDAGAHQTFSQVDTDRDSGDPTGRSRKASRGRAVSVPRTEFNLKVFNLGSPIVCKGPFDVSAGGPAGLCFCGGAVAECRLRTAKGATSRPIKKNAIDHVTCPRAMSANFPDQRNHNYLSSHWWRKTVQFISIFNMLLKTPICVGHHRSSSSRGENLPNWGP